jgi:hypothetical protein
MDSKHRFKKQTSHLNHFKPTRMDLNGFQSATLEIRKMEDGFNHPTCGPSQLVMLQPTNCGLASKTWG